MSLNKRQKRTQKVWPFRRNIFVRVKTNKQIQNELILR